MATIFLLLYHIIMNIKQFVLDFCLLYKFVIKSLAITINLRV